MYTKLEFQSFFIRNHFIKNLHVEGQKASGTYTTNDKIHEDLSILIYVLIFINPF